MKLSFQRAPDFIHVLRTRDAGRWWCLVTIARVQEWVSSSGTSCDLHTQSVIHTHNHTSTLLYGSHFPHRNLSMLPNFLMLFLKFLSLFFQSWSESSWGVKHPNTVSRTSTSGVTNMSCGTFLEAEPWVQGLLGLVSGLLWVSLCRGWHRDRAKAGPGQSCTCWLAAAGVADQHSFSRQWGTASPCLWVWTPPRTAMSKGIFLQQFYLPHVCKSAHFHRCSELLSILSGRHRAFCREDTLTGIHVWEKGRDSCPSRSDPSCS